MEMLILLLVVLALLAPPIIAKRKGRSFFAWLIYSILFWIIAMPHALLASPNQAALDRRALAHGRRCPSCAEIVRAEAIVCRYCGSPL